MDSRDRDADDQPKAQMESRFARLPPLAAASLIVYLEDFRVEVACATDALVQARLSDRADLAIFAARRIDRYRDILRVCAHGARYPLLCNLAGELAGAACKHVETKANTVCRRHVRIFAESLRESEQRLFERADALVPGRPEARRFAPIHFQHLALSMPATIPELETSEEIMAWFDAFGDALNYGLMRAIDRSYARQASRGRAYAARIVTEIAV